MYFVKEQYSRGKINGVNKIAAVIDADTASDLPEYNNCRGIDGELTLGTIAFVADEVVFYGLTSSGVWHKQGEDSSSKSVNSLKTKIDTTDTSKKSINTDEKSALPDMPEEFYQKDAEPLESLLESDDMGDENAELL